MPSRRSVDVIVPCYNYGRFLRRCVASVLNQPVDVRVLVIDDASTDDSASIAMALANGDKRVTFLSHRENRGHTATYNEGLEWASAEYVLLLSADDVLAKNALGDAVNLMSERPEVVLTYGLAPLFTTEPELERLERAEAKGRWEVRRGIDYLWDCCASASNPIPTATAVGRTSVQKDIGGYRADLPHSCDMEMWLRFAAYGDIAVKDAPQAFRRTHGANMELAYLTQDLGDLVERQLAFERFFQAFGSRVSSASEMHSSAVRSLAEIAFWRGSEAFDRGDVRQCHQYMEYAKSCNPHLTASRMWWRFKLKATIGCVAVGRLKRVIGAVQAS